MQLSSLGQNGNNSGGKPPSWAAREELWDITMQVRDPDVFESCSDFLVSCHVFLKPDPPDAQPRQRRGEVQARFLQTCMSYLRTPALGFRL